MVKLKYEFWHDFVKPKYQNFVIWIQTVHIHVKTENIYNNIAEDAEISLTLQFLNYIDHCLKKKNEKVIEFMKVELDEQIIKEFVRLITKTCSYLKDKNDENRKANDTENCIIKAYHNLIS